MISNQEKKELFKFSCFIVFVLALILSILVYKGKAEAVWIFSALIPLALYFICPAFLKLFEKALVAVGHVLGTINSFIILFVLFCFILTPLAVMKRLLKGVSLPRGKSDDKTYWNDVKSECNWQRQF